MDPNANANANPTPPTAAEPATDLTSRPRSREWWRVARGRSINRRISVDHAHHHAGGFPRSPMHPFHLPAISIIRSPSTTRGPGSAGLPISRVSSELIEAEIRRVTTPLPIGVRGGHVGGGGERERPRERSQTAAAAELESRNVSKEGVEGVQSSQRRWRRSCLAWKGNEIIRAKISAVVFAGVVLLVMLIICEFGHPLGVPTSIDEGMSAHADMRYPT